MRVGLQVSIGVGLFEGVGGLAVELGKAEIEAASGGIADEGFDEARRLGVLHVGHPVFGAEKYRYLRRMVVVGEWPVGAQRVFELVDREAGIGCEKRARGVHRLEHHFRTASAAHAETKHAEEIGHVWRVAALHFDDVFFVGQLFQLMRL